MWVWFNLECWCCLCCRHCNRWSCFWCFALLLLLALLLSTPTGDVDFETNFCASWCWASCWSGYCNFFVCFLWSGINHDHWSAEDHQDEENAKFHSGCYFSRTKERCQGTEPFIGHAHRWLRSPTNSQCSQFVSGERIDTSHRWRRTNVSTRNMCRDIESSLCLFTPLTAMESTGGASSELFQRQKVSSGTRAPEFKNQLSITDASRPPMYTCWIKFVLKWRRHLAGCSLVCYLLRSLYL